MTQSTPIRVSKDAPHRNMDSDMCLQIPRALFHVRLRKDFRVNQNVVHSYKRKRKKWIEKYCQFTSLHLHYGNLSRTFEAIDADS